MRLRQLLIAGLIFLTSSSFSQKLGKDHYWISFEDKAFNDYNLFFPSEFLSQRALDRRLKQNIDITELDLPVSQRYLDSLQRMGIQIKGTSRWLNAAIVQSTDSLLLDSLNSIEFIRDFNPLLNTVGPFPQAWSRDTSTSNELDSEYVSSAFQISIFNGNTLHELGFLGKGMHIAVIDAGFDKVDVLDAFSALRNDRRILGFKDFANPGSENYSSSSHGTSVLSTMAAVIPGVYTGTAPEASYWLLRSEITSSETKLEEALWIMAAEFADSVGVDIINSSLGYTTFDDPSMNYSYQDLDGTKSLITTAAEIAFSRGMLVVSSAGNEGNKKWRYISAPADGEHVLTVGAIDTALEIAAFSSIGPAADGRIKPDIVALGSNLRVINTSGVPVPGYGTSFSSPLIAGMAACLWQSSPLKTNREIVDAIKTTASRAMNPDNIYGYGIPNFMLALRKLKSAQVPTIDKGVLVFPNPFSEAVEIDFINIPSNVERVSIYSSEGKIVYSKTGNVGNFGYITLDSSDIPEPGLYLLVVYAGNDIFTSKLIRQE